MVLLLTVVPFCVLAFATSHWAPLQEKSCQYEEVAVLQRKSSLLQSQQMMQSAKGLIVESSLVDMLQHNLVETTSAPVEVVDAADITNVKRNSAGDLWAMLGAMMVSWSSFIFCVILFMFMHRSYPKMYTFRATTGWSEAEEEEEWLSKDWTEADLDKSDEMKLFKKRDNFPAPKSCRFNAETLEWKSRAGWLQWLVVSWKTDSEEIEKACGLDSAMLLVFVDMSMRMMLICSIPMVFLGIPMYSVCGGGLAKEDLLSRLGVGNVVFREARLSVEDAALIPSIQWIFWVLGFFTWFVVIYVCWELMQYQQKFMKRRKAWLIEQPEPQSTTILIENLPSTEESRDEGVALDWDNGSLATFFKKVDWNNENLATYFEKLFGSDQIKGAYVVQKVSTLRNLINAYNAAAIVTEPDQSALAQLKDAIKAEQTAFKADRFAHSAPNAFVTFKTPLQRNAALHHRHSSSSDHFIIRSPPPPSDVIYNDLEADTHWQLGYDIAGYACLAGLFFFFIPLVLAISKLVSVENWSDSVRNILKAAGCLHAMEGAFASMGLTIMMSMLPTFIMWIFCFWKVKSNEWAQVLLQKIYFWFLVVFVLLVTCVGSGRSGIGGTLAAIAESPPLLFTLLASRIPFTTHFFMNYVIMQPLTHGMNLTRYINVIMFFCSKRNHSDEDARFLSEPEDQDYYGLGSRSARFSFMLVVGLVFGTICPLMNVLVFVNFLICKVVYGYLIPCAESRKNDLGGDHWCQSLRHVMESMLIYIILMAGILELRAESRGPALIAGASFLFWAVFYYKLTHTHWESLALSDMLNAPANKVVSKSCLTEYSQNIDDILLQDDPEVWQQLMTK